MIRIAIALAAAASIVAATPAAAQHAGHGAHPAPAKPATQSHDAHAAHGAAAGRSAEHMSGWVELDAYHMVMMKAWHPAKDSGNVAPARAQAAALATAADAWAASSIPAPCDTPAARAAVHEVHAGSRAFAQMVGRKAADAEVLAALRTLHEQFEVVNRGCKAR